MLRAVKTSDSVNLSPVSISFFSFKRFRSNLFATKSTDYKGRVLTNVYTEVTMALQRCRMFTLESFPWPFQVH